MKSDIAVVIPCYNHSNVLRRTLLALAHQTVQPREVIVVDDASDDLTEEVVGKIEGLEVRWMRLRHNHGAPYARNEGARLTSATYLLFLDADAELVPNALELMMDTLEKHPETDFAYGNFYWGSKRFRLQPFDAESLKKRNYIHTSALMRRKVFPGFDESLKKFQDWDLWLTMSENGSKGVWIDRELMHIEPRKEGISRWLPKVAYMIPWQKLGFQPKEIGRYREAEKIVRKKHGIEHLSGTGTDATAGWIPWIGVIVLLEAISLATVFVPPARAVATILAAALMALVAMRRPDLGLAALLAELAIGSKGALLKIPEGWEVDGGTSLRMVITAAFLIGWCVNAASYWSTERSRIVPRIQEMIRGRMSWIALAIVIAWAAIRGAWMKQAFFLSDANAWVELVLLLPVLDVAMRTGERLVQSGRDALVAALLWIPVKTLSMLYVWSHGIKLLSQPLYLWIRRTGVGEVTLVTANLFRVFIQSQIYALAGFLGLLVAPGKMAWSRVGRLLLIGSAVSLLVGLSRSLWIGLAAGGLGLLILAVIPSKEGIQPPRGRQKTFWMLFGRGAFSMSAAVLLIAAVVAFPFPHVEVGSLKTLFGSRASTGDAAAESRWNLLPVLGSKIKEHPILGSGFGASVTYQSKDPRILAEHPDGIYTTYAFEWGWLEFWIKFGILGIPVMLWVLISLGLRLSRSTQEAWIKHAGLATLVGLAALHVFTPYLNHPLGFGILLSIEALIAADRKRA